MVSASQSQKPERFGPWTALFVVALGYFMNIIDSGAVNVAVPSIATDLDASARQLLWVLNGYLFTFAMLLLLCGRLGDLVGHRNMFFGGLLLFTAASLACALADTTGALIAWRVAQGVGAAAMAPQALAVTAAVFPPQRRAMAFGVLASILGSAAAAAPILGGVLTEAWGWRAIFYLNLPIGVAGLAVTYLVLPATREPGRRRLPVAASLLASAGMFAMLYALIQGPQVGWGRVAGPVGAVPLLVAGVVALVAFVLWDRARVNGLLPRVVFTSRDYALMVWASAATYFGIFATQLVMTFYLQSALGAGPLATGLVLSPMWIVASLVALLSGRLAARVPARTLLIGGYLAFAVGIAVTALLTYHRLPWGTFVPALTFAGAGVGLTFAPLTTVAMGKVARAEFSGASGLIEAVRQIGAVVCIAAIGAILQAVWADGLRSRVAAATTGLSGASRAVARGGAVRLIGRGLHPGTGGPVSDVGGAIGHLLSSASVRALVSAARPALLTAAAVILTAAFVSRSAGAAPGGAPDAGPGSGGADSSEGASPDSRDADSSRRRDSL